MFERDFHCGNFTVQLGQFVAILNVTDISVSKSFESLKNFGKN